MTKQEIKNCTDLRFQIKIIKNMFKIVDKIQFNPEENKMKIVADTSNAIKMFNSDKSKNLRFFFIKGLIG